MSEHIDSEIPTKQSLSTSTPPKILAVIKNNQSHTQKHNDTSLSVESLEIKSAEATQLLATEDETKRSLAVKQTLKPQIKKNQSLALKFLESITNADGEVFTIGSKILIIRSTFGTYNAIIEELYQTADGIVWAKYSELLSDGEPQRRGYCRASLLIQSHED